MSNLITDNSFNQIIEAYKKLILNEGVALNMPVDTNEINNFERLNNVRLPQNLVSCLFVGNGFKEGELLGLANLWPLTSFVKVIDFLKFNGQLSNEVTDAIIKGVPYSSLSPDENKLVGEQLDWLLREASSYYLFGDYNINACYWAIKLSDDSPAQKNEIICIYDWGNSYVSVAADFTEFLSVLVKEGAEALL